MQRDIARVDVRTKMKPVSIDEAHRVARQLLHVDHEKVVKLLTLRAAQVKYVLNRPEMRSDENVESFRDALLPPVSQNEDALIQYGLAQHEEFTTITRPRIEQHSSNAVQNKEWLNELEETFLEMRRIVMQNLSKHPALRPYNLLTKVQEQLHERQENNLHYRILLQKKRMMEEDLQRADEEEALLKSGQGFETLQRLEESLNELVNEKRALDDHWMKCWSTLSVVFKRFTENEKAAEKLENAQYRMIQLYLSNPSITRDRDAHSKGLIMILRLVVSALEEGKKWFKDMSNEDVRTTVLRALEDPVFVNYQEHVHALDAAISRNQEERDARPLHHELISLRQKKLALELQREHTDEELFQVVRAREAMDKTIHHAWNDAREACRAQLNMELEKISEP